MAVYCAGQAIVQMAKCKFSGIEYAIKFYVSLRAFKKEAHLYSKKRSSKNLDCLSQFLPLVRPKTIINCSSVAPLTPPV